MKPEELREVMRHFPTGVTVVTSIYDGIPRGVTVSAFASVSLEPPLVLVCINREARSYLFIAQSKVFCVNVLSDRQQQLAERFAAKLPAENQFKGVEYYVDQTGAAVLDGALAHVDCRVLQEHMAGSHSIFIGEAISSAAQPGKPLGYCNGRYHDFGVEIG